MRKHFCNKELYPLIATCWFLWLLLYTIGIPCVIDNSSLKNDCMIAKLSIKKSVTHILQLIFFFHSFYISGSNTSHQLLSLVSIETHENRVWWLVCNFCRKHISRYATIVALVTTLTSEELLILLHYFLSTVFFWTREIKSLIVISYIWSVTIHLILSSKKTPSCISGSASIYRFYHLANQPILVIIDWSTITGEIIGLRLAINVFNLFIRSIPIPLHKLLCPLSFRINFKVSIISKIHLLPIVIDNSTPLHCHHMPAR